MMQGYVDSADDARYNASNFAFANVVIVVLIGLGCLIALWGVHLLGHLPDWLIQWGSVLIVVFTGWKAMQTHLHGYAQGVYDANMVYGIGDEAVSAYVEWKYRSAPALPQPTQEVFPYSKPSRSPEYIAGLFDVRDVESLCLAFSLGAAWSEAKLIDRPLPITKEPLTKTLYYKLLDEVLVFSGVIGFRGGPGNKTGKLIITEPEEMMAAIRKKYPPTPSKQASP